MVSPFTLPDSPTRHSALWIPQGTFLCVEKLVHSGLEGTEKICVHCVVDGLGAILWLDQ